MLKAASRPDLAARRPRGPGEREQRGGRDRQARVVGRVGEAAHREVEPRRVRAGGHAVERAVEAVGLFAARPSRRRALGELARSRRRRPPGGPASPRCDGQNAIRPSSTISPSGPSGRAAAGEAPGCSGAIRTRSAPGRMRKLQRRLEHRGLAVDPRRHRRRRTRPRSAARSSSAWPSAARARGAPPDARRRRRAARSSRARRSRAARRRSSGASPSRAPARGGRRCSRRGSRSPDSAPPRARSSASSGGRSPAERARRPSPRSVRIFASRYSSRCTASA